MKLRLADKQLAIKLRKDGLTYSEIRSIIPNLSKSTLSNWIKGIDLSDEQRMRINLKAKSIIEKARLKGAWANKIKFKKRIQDIQHKAREEFDNLMKENLFIIGLSLYWAEGSKKSRMFQFMNSDPKMIQLIINWLQLLGIDRSQIKVRLYIHKLYQKENPELFWQEYLHFDKKNFLKTIYKPTQHSIKKNSNYKGCCRIEIRGSELFWKIQKWQELMVNQLCPRGETDIT